MFRKIDKYMYYSSMLSYPNKVKEMGFRILKVRNKECNVACETHLASSFKSRVIFKETLEARFVDKVQ